MDPDREAYCELMRKELIGPSGGIGEEVRDRPDKRYLMGMLFPQDALADNALEDEEEDGEDSRAAREAESATESPTDLLFQRLPASVGVSFAVEGNSAAGLDIQLGCGRYVRVGSKWKHSHKADSVSLSVDLHSTIRLDVLDGAASLFAVMRLGARGARVVTVSLVNNKRLEDPEARIDPSDVLFQVGLAIHSSEPVPNWPSPDRLTIDEEEDELQLRYRHHAAYAVGHGCAARWEKIEGSVRDVMVEFLPQSTVAPVTTEIDLADYPQAQEMHRLQVLQSTETAVPQLVSGLESLVAAYQSWRLKLESIQDFESAFSPARDRILGRIDKAILRMKSGIALLQADNQALLCFRLANRAMLIQMVYADRVAAVEQKGATPSPAGVPNVSDPVHRGRAWRPFQLAFFLMSLQGLWDPDSDDRDTVDLIWFPTGGGKTEAYLAAAAFEMIRRRMQLGAAGGGTAVITRYTLRLLTQQQFQRSAHLICALEDLRALNPSLGVETFSLGLWIGEKSTPLYLRKARSKFLEKVCNPDGKHASNPFALMSCPVCGTPLVPSSKPELSSEGVGIASTETSFSFFCPDERCHRHSSIPVQVIDEALYESPPSMLLGTLDKFAMLAWKDQAVAFFGRVGGVERFAPPSLVIQDELHLISGPLGTIAGLYEAAFDTVIRSRGGNAKVIASTATIRRAGEQTGALFAKAVDVFPPPGLDSNDSFFSTKSEGEGRLYLGAMGQGHTPTFSVVMTSAAMMQSVQDLAFAPEKADSWWTLVAYHNSRRELGKSLTMANDDIPARLTALRGKDARRVRLVKELSANVPGEEVPKVLDELKQELAGGNAVDFLGCTNMLSVGVDVARLGLMLVVGQPRSASEYIQASSRVGRDSRRLPGVVLTLFMPTKPRDRSHYESFSTFHEAMYRFVEPTSVTPYALPARRRALHAAVVIAVRHFLSGLSNNTAAGNINSFGADIGLLRARLIERMAGADSLESAGIRRDIDQFITEWKERAASSNLRYSAGKNAINFRSLLRTFGDSSDLDARETLQSMRHVDRIVRAKIWGQKAPDEDETTKARHPPRRRRSA